MLCRRFSSLLAQYNCRRWQLQSNVHQHWMITMMRELSCDLHVMAQSRSRYGPDSLQLMAGSSRDRAPPPAGCLCTLPGPAARALNPGPVPAGSRQCASWRGAARRLGVAVRLSAHAGTLGCCGRAPGGPQQVHPGLLPVWSPDAAIMSWQACPASSQMLLIWACVWSSPSRHLPKPLTQKPARAPSTALLWLPEPRLMTCHCPVSTYWVMVP